MGSRIKERKTQLAMTDFDGDKLLRRDMSGAVKKAVGAWLIPLRIVWLTAIVCGCAAIVASCGYRFPGGGGPPKGLETIFIRLIENRTSEIGVEIDLTNQLKNEFSRKYGGQLAPEDRAQGILSGKITGVRSWTVARRGAQASLEKRVSVTIDLTLKNQAGEVLWFTRGMTDSEVYTVEQSDKALTESNKRKAIEVVCLRLGEDAYYRMTDDF